jgi:hypothetical protein
MHIAAILDLWWLEEALNSDAVFAGKDTIQIDKYSQVYFVIR